MRRLGVTPIAERDGDRSVLVPLARLALNALLIAAGIALIAWVCVRLRLVAVPLLAALLAAALLLPVADELRRRGVPSLAATFVTLIATGLVLAVRWRSSRHRWPTSSTRSVATPGRVSARARMAHRGSARTGAGGHRPRNRPSGGPAARELRAAHARHRQRRDAPSGGRSWRAALGSAALLLPLRRPAHVGLGREAAARASPRGCRGGR